MNTGGRLRDPLVRGGTAFWPRSRIFPNPSTSCGVASRVQRLVTCDDLWLLGGCETTRLILGRTSGYGVRQIFSRSWHLYKIRVPPRAEFTVNYNAWTTFWLRKRWNSCLAEEERRSGQRKAEPEETRNVRDKKGQKQRSGKAKANAPKQTSGAGEKRKRSHSLKSKEARQDETGKAGNRE